MYIEFLKKYLSHNPDALAWVLGYTAYAHAIDDIVDKANTSPDFILNTFRLAISVYTYPFFQTYSHILRPLLEASHDSYRDSVIMEKSPEEWALRTADIIRSNANDVVLMVIMIASDLHTRNAASLELRQLSYNTHHDQKGLPT